MKKRGFTLIELLVTIIIVSIIIMAIVGIFMASDRAFKKNRPVSDVIEEMRSGVATLDFVFSRWGVGIPCKANNCTYNSEIVPCNGYPPSDPMCITCNVGDLSSGCSDLEFYGNLYGMGIVVNATSNSADLISCRLESENSNQNCYYIWKGGEVINYNSTTPPIYGFNKVFNSTDCINFSGAPNLTINNITMQQLNGNSSYTLQTGDLITRVPHKIRLYVYKDEDGGYWLMMDTTDMAENCRSNETARKIAKLKDGNSFKVYGSGKAIKVSATFSSQSKPEEFFNLERYFGR